MSEETKERVRKQAKGLGFTEEEIESIARDVDNSMNKPLIKFFFGARFAGINLFEILMITGIAVCGYFGLRSLIQP